MAEDSVGVPGSAVPGLLGYPSGNPVPRSTVSASFLLLDTAKPVSLVLAKKRSRGLEIHLLSHIYPGPCCHLGPDRSLSWGRPVCRRTLSSVFGLWVPIAPSPAPRASEK